MDSANTSTTNAGKRRPLTLHLVSVGIKLRIAATTIVGITLSVRGSRTASSKTRVNEAVHNRKPVGAWYRVPTMKFFLAVNRIASNIPTSIATAAVIRNTLRVRNGASLSLTRIVETLHRGLVRRTLGGYA